MMSTSYTCPENDQTILLSLTPGIAYDFNSPEALSRPHYPAAAEGGATSNKKRPLKPTVAKLHTYFRPWWNTILVTSSAIAVSFDPLFFYIPYINQEAKCMGMDAKVKIAALVLRSITDFPLVMNIIWQLYQAINFAAGRLKKCQHLKLHTSTAKPLVYSGFHSSRRDQIVEFAKAFSLKLSWPSFIIDILSIFPIPQLLMMGVFYKMSDDDYFDNRKAMGGFLLVQYLPRIYRIYLSSTILKYSTALWVRGAFNFFLYILASHVLGAFWYFFSIQRETSCWHQKICEECDFICGNYSVIDQTWNQTFVDQTNIHCTIHIPYNVTDPPFDFGIFLDALKNIAGEINFSRKLAYCFWWGLRNLSNYGTNLSGSSYVWENCFAVLVSLTGLLLFLYLIGNIQIYMERETTTSMEVKERIQNKRNDIEKWMDRNQLQDDMKHEIMKNIKEKLEENRNADLENIFTLLPWYTKKALKRILCMNTLKKVPMLRNVEEKVLKMICDYLKPVNYREDTLVFKLGEPLDRVVFITEGFMWTYTTCTESDHAGTKPTSTTAQGLPTSSSMDTNLMKNGDFYGHELLHFLSSSYSTLTQLPTSAANVRCHTSVEAFVLIAKDLRSVITKCENWWPFDYNASQDVVADGVAISPPRSAEPKKHIAPYHVQSVIPEPSPRRRTHLQLNNV